MNSTWLIRLLEPRSLLLIIVGFGDMGWIQSYISSLLSSLFNCQETSDFFLLYSWSFCRYLFYDMHMTRRSIFLCVVFCEWWEYFWLINPTILKGRKPIYICIDMNYSAETGLLRLLFHVEFWVFFPFLLFYKTKPLCQTSKTMKRAKFKQKRV